MVETAQYASESLSPFSIVNRVVDWPCCPAFPNFPCSEKWSWPWTHSREDEHKACMPLLGQSWSSGHASSILTRWRAITAKFKQIWKVMLNDKVFISVDPWKTLWSQPPENLGLHLRMVCKTEIKFFLFKTLGGLFIIATYHILINSRVIKIWHI